MPPSAASRRPHFSALATASGLGLVLLLGRMKMTHTHDYAFYPWNLFLAWLPLLFAELARAAARSGRVGWPIAAAVLWLLFLPNAPYLATDLVHWQPRPGVPVWFDLLLCLHFAWLGLALGFISLQIMEAEVTRQCGERWGRIFAVSCLSLTSFGIYLGRFRRWNSWDLVSSPAALLGDISTRIANPLSHRGTWAFTLICALFLGSAYAVLGTLKNGPSTSGGTDKAAPRPSD